MKRLQKSSSSAGSAATAEHENPQPGPHDPQTDPQSLQPESENLNNQALDRCIKAWHRNFNLASINPRDQSLNFLDVDAASVFAGEQGALAFREAMPLLISYENIRDFIACTTYAMLTNIFDKDDCRELLNAAKIAMALLRTNPRPRE
jgi:hypothetical protein